jgi:Kef-type K+ transport system membrane component KefB
VSHEIANLLVILLVVWGVGLAFSAMKLPLLLGELLAGLLFGPALIGLFQDTETVRILAELGIFFLMLHAGLETEPHQLLRASRRGLAIAIAGMVLPLALGTAVGLAFGTTWMQAIFIGMGMSITAISVTVKIFKDFDYKDRDLVDLVMAAALADDILAFVLVSVVLAFATAGTLSPADTGFLLLKVVAFFATILFIGVRLLRPLFDRFFSRLGGTAFPLTIILGLLFGLIAEKLGIHYVIGAYMAGLFLKREHINGAVFARLEDRLYGLAYGFLGPIFFVSLGFSVQFAAFAEPRALLFLIAVLVASIVGKVVGSGGVARLMGTSPRKAAVIGFAMNGRGAVELILATIGLEAGIITPEIFSILVFMAFFTTFITPIGLKMVIREEPAPA